MRRSARARKRKCTKVCFCWVSRGVGRGRARGGIFRKGVPRSFSGKDFLEELQVVVGSLNILYGFEL